MIFDILAVIWSFFIRFWWVWTIVYLTYWRGPSLRRAYQRGRLNFYRSFGQVDFRGFEVLVVDLERSIVLRGNHWLFDETIEVFLRAKAEGVRVVCLLTNKRRIRRTGSGDFSGLVQQVESVGFDKVVLIQPRWPHPFKIPRKPYRWTFRWVWWRCGRPRRRLVLACGDKVRWDVLRPIKMRWNGAVVEPLGADDGKSDKIFLTRPIENLTLSWFGLSRWGPADVPALRWLGAWMVLAFVGTGVAWSLSGIVVAIFAVFAWIALAVAVSGFYTLNHLSD